MSLKRQAPSRLTGEAVDKKQSTSTPAPEAAAPETKSAKKPAAEETKQTPPAAQKADSKPAEPSEASTEGVPKPESQAEIPKPEAAPKPDSKPAPEPEEPAVKEAEPKASAEPEKKPEQEAEQAADKEVEPKEAPAEEAPEPAAEPESAPEPEPTPEPKPEPGKPQPPQVQFGTQSDFDKPDDSEKLPWEEGGTEPEPSSDDKPVFSWGEDAVSDKPEPVHTKPKYTEPKFTPPPADDEAEAPTPPDLSALLDDDKPAAPEEKPAASGQQYPWQQQSSDGSKAPPPELPLSQKIPGMSRLNETVRGFTVFGLVGVVLFVGYLLFFKNNEGTTELLARWTGAFNEVSREVPAAEESVLLVSDEMPAEPAPAIEMAEEDRVQIAVLEPRPTPASPTPPLLVETPASEPMEPAPILVETASDPEPVMDDENVSMANRLQSAISKAREQNRRQARSTGETPQASTLTPEEQALQDLELRRELEEELAAYRKTLAETRNPALLPKPDQFFREYRGEEGSQPTANTASTIEPPVVYNSNPNNLPVVPEPGATTDPEVRTLSDFEVAGFRPSKQRVRIPRGVAPQMNAMTFPELTVLSLVPNRGMIAERGGQQGVLLIGESISGWELIAVHREYAEFQNGVRRHTVTFTPELAGTLN